MQKIFKLTVFVFFISTMTINAQTQRDTLVSQIIYNLPKEKASYEKLKKDIKKLEQLEGKPKKNTQEKILVFFYSLKP